MYSLTRLLFRGEIYFTYLLTYFEQILMDLAIDKLKDPDVLKDRVYRSLRDAISSLDVYVPGVNLRLDERTLANQLGVSRTPIRESLIRLENEGFVKTIPHRGAFVVRKSLEEILNMVYVWAALEGMAARLLTERATDEEIGKLRELFSTHDGSKFNAHINEYSETNVEFHRTIIEMSACPPLIETAENLFLHLKTIRLRSIADPDRVKNSVIDHMNIIEALEARDADNAEILVRNHTLRLAEHIKTHLELEDSD